MEFDRLLAGSLWRAVAIYFGQIRIGLLSLGSFLAEIEWVFYYVTIF